MRSGLTKDKALQAVARRVHGHSSAAKGFDGCTHTTVGRTLMLTLRMTSAAALATVPQAIAEPQLTLFKFYIDQVVQEGMVYGKALYQRAKQFSADELLEADQYRCALMEQGVPAVMSVSTQRYIVWTRLESASATLAVHP